MLYRVPENYISKIEVTNVAIDSNSVTSLIDEIDVVDLESVKSTTV